MSPIPNVVPITPIAAPMSAKHQTRFGLDMPAARNCTAGRWSTSDKAHAQPAKPVTGKKEAEIQKILIAPRLCRAGPAQCRTVPPRRMNGSNGSSECIVCLLVRQLRDGDQIQCVSLIGVELGKPRSHIDQAGQPIKPIHREIDVLGDAGYPLDSLLVGAQFPGLVPAMASDEVG